MVNVGEKAPLFTLQNQDKELTSLDSYAGKWVLIYFYPKALTSGCTVQACALRDAKNDLKKLGLEVLGISPDKPELLKKFEQNDQLNFTLLGDTDHTVAESYGTWGEKSMYGRTYMGMTRASFLVDPSGVVQAVWPKVDPKTHWDTIREWMENHAREAA